VASVLAGGLLGLAVGSGLPQEYAEVAGAAIGIGVCAMGVKMFFSSENVLIPIGSMILGGLAGHLVGLQAGMDALGEAASKSLGGSSASFRDSFVASSILFCAGPMTILGCLEEGLHKKTDLLSLKSVLDGVSSIFFAAAYGPGVLLSAVTVLVVQGSLTLAAKRLRYFAEEPRVLEEVSATGGLILLALALGLLKLRDLPTADYLPAIVFAAVLASWINRRSMSGRPRMSP
jgi:uncharacterized membrane protein YqgA involved in biofilm formation